MLELARPTAATLIALSTDTALDAVFGPAQRRVTLEYHTDEPDCRVPIPTIERIGGGGVRCMLAEIHLPKRA